jgi:hypothetical protein
VWLFCLGAKTMRWSSDRHIDWLIQLCKSTFPIALAASLFARARALALLIYISTTTDGRTEREEDAADAVGAFAVAARIPMRRADWQEHKYCNFWSDELINIRLLYRSVCYHKVLFTHMYACTGRDGGWIRWNCFCHMETWFVFLVVFLHLYLKWNWTRGKL